MIKNTCVVSRPVEEVFDYLAQFDRHPEWQHDLKTATIDGPAAVGVKGTETRQMGPRVHTYEWRVSAFERPSKLGFETLTGPMRPAGSIALSPDGDGTRIDFQMDLNPRGLMKLMSPMISRQVQRTNDEHMAKLKELLESGVS
jgi:uncharacterized protein YndB with AHSA1/START domain